MRRLFLTAVLCVLALQAWAVAQENYKTETLGACSDKALADGIRNALQPQGTRLVDSKGTAVAEVWLRRNVPLKSGASDANYGSLAEGTLVGLLNFPAKGSDFRGQPIKPGLYTLRYAQIPQDGNHMGAAPQPNFLLLSPAAADKSPDAISKEALIKLSRQASGSNHPAVLMLIPATGASSVQQNDQGHVAVVIKTQAGGSDKGAPFPFAIVLVGKAES